MIERTPLLNILTHVILVFGLLILLFPMYLVIVAASHTLQDVSAIPPKLLPGDQLWVNMQAAWTKGNFGQMFVNTFIVSFWAVISKIVLACLTAFGIVFFDRRLKMPIFWLVFITLTLPLEVRIVPTYAVAANALLPFRSLLDVTGITWAINAVSGVQVALEWNIAMAGTLIVMIPPILVVIFMQRWFVHGLINTDK